MQPIDEIKSSHSYCRLPMLFVLVAMQVLSGGICCEAGENDWFVYLGTKETHFRPFRCLRRRCEEPSARSRRSPTAWSERSSGESPLHLPIRPARLEPLPYGHAEVRGEFAGDGFEISLAEHQSQ
jgi:hypothetical protein